jgi:hypothetical protein
MVDRVEFSLFSTDEYQPMMAAGHQSMLLPRARGRDGTWRSAIAQKLLLLGFASGYAGGFLLVLNSSAHLPRFWMTNPHFMDGSGRFLCLAAGALLVLTGLVGAPHVYTKIKHTDCRVEGLCKARRIAGWLWAFSVLCGLISLPYMAWYFFEERQMLPHNVVSTMLRIEQSAAAAC